MTNTALLWQKTEETGCELCFIAKQLGITYQEFQNKVNNISEFKASEIKCLQKLLRLTDQDREAIFFDDSVDFRSTKAGESYFKHGNCI